jgi:hypothetical protein
MIVPVSVTGGRHVRARDVLWRSGPGVVLVRRVDDPDDQILELGGGAGLLWLALDQPTSADEVAEAFGAPVTEVEQALDMLRERRLVVPA